MGWLSNANLIPRDRPDLAAVTALAGQYMGARLVITDSGSGAPSPASVEMISAVKSQLDIPYFYAGGCKTPEQASQIIKAGADGIHVGTAFEKEDNNQKAKEKVRKMVRAIKEAGKDKIKHPISKCDFRLLSENRKKILVKNGGYSAVMKRFRQIEFFKHRGAK